MIPKVKKILDITQILYSECPTSPASRPPVFYEEQSFYRDGFVGERINMNVHTSTHMDAPRHFIENGEAIDQLGTWRLQGRAVVADLRKIGASPVTGEHLLPMETVVRKGDWLILYTGWSREYGKTNRYVMDYPYISVSAAEWIADHALNGVCTDGLRAGGTPEGTGFPPHHIILGAGIIIVEEVKLDDRILEEPEWYLTAYPLRLKDFGGSPARVTVCTFEDI